MDVGLVHSNVITFLAAGQVTTSSALSWVRWHLICNLVEKNSPTFSSGFASQPSLHKPGSSMLRSSLPA